MTIERNVSSRKAVYSVTEVATLCGMSRASFYAYIDNGVMPMPIYCLRTRRPLYPAVVAALCVRIRETNVGNDGQYVMFYGRKGPKADVPCDRPVPRRQAPPDPLLKEMIEALRLMKVQADDEQLTAAVAEQCPQGVKEATFEVDLRAVFDACRRRNAV